ncbi:tetratricopeptide repeat protein [Hymenobacter jeollabukensis]|uniref:Uncharacterized protein n=1 Tax=Hymenobacter jeollabukensis TaxID=2025313 RepID=A0A5R8WK47_9BACT|nr:hypothetical protein [Hymenobacter jeollabukensis]TLM89168.1 hypothetical protein FDY95_21600 [Hymenobacter jeollabukensis]
MAHRTPQTLLLTAALGLLSLAPAAAQSARSHYQQAELAYEAGKYTEALYYLGETERALGGTNARIQSLRTHTYYAQGDNVHALVELTRYFRAAGAAAQGSEAYRDMQALREELTSGNKAYFEQQKQTATQGQAQELKTLDAELAREQEELTYKVVKESGSKQALQDFLRQYPNSSHAGEATASIGAVERQVQFETLVEQGEAHHAAGRWQSALQSYEAALKLHGDSEVRGNAAEVRRLYASQLTRQGDEHAAAARWSEAVRAYERADAVLSSPELSAALRTARDEAAFAAADRSRSDEQYAAYLADFSNGRHVPDAVAARLNLQLARAEQAQKQGQTEAVETALADVAKLGQSSVVWPAYRGRYYALLRQEATRLTSGKKAERVKQVDRAIGYYQQLDQAQPNHPYAGKLRHLQAKRKAWSHEDFGYFAYRRDLRNEVGFDLGYNTNLSWGGFFSLRGTAQALAASIPTNGFPRRGRQYSQGFFNFNFTKKVTYPLWVYAGGGYAHFVRIQDVPGYPANGILPNDNPQKGGGVNTEFGAIVKIRWAALSVGVSAPQFSAEKRQILGLNGNPTIVNAAIGIYY